MKDFDERYGSFENALQTMKKNCTYCNYRHSCFKDIYPGLYKECPDFEIGGCLTCKNRYREDQICAGGICQSVLAFDFEKCKNYKKDRERWKTWKKYRK